MNRWRNRAIIFFKRSFFLPRNQRRLMALISATLLSLFLAEAVVRLGGFDWRLIKKMLYYQMADRPTHQADPNPEIIFRLKPGNADYGARVNGYVVHINALGSRDPERPAAKPPGLFRIICVGGSNVYGMGLQDRATWPAQLEVRLNRDRPGRYEVWNFGTSAYVPMQMAALAKEKAEEIHADLIVFALSNGGAPAFLWGKPPAPIFQRAPDYWRALFDAEGCLIGPESISAETRYALIRHVRLYRLAAAYYAAERERCTWAYSQLHEKRSIARTKELYDWCKKHGVKICLFLYPGTLKNGFDYSSYYRGIDVPVLSLAEPGLPPEYYNVHPPAHVMTWYADRLGSWLLAEGLAD